MLEYDRSLCCSWTQPRAGPSNPGHTAGSPWHRRTGGGAPCPRSPAHRLQAQTQNTYPLLSLSKCLTAVGVLTGFTAVPLYKGVSLFLLLMSGSAPASRRHCTHDKCSRDTASSRAVCSCKVRLSTEPGWAVKDNKHTAQTS